MNKTDLGNAERFARDHAEKVRFTKTLGWLCWDLTRWKPDAAGEVEQLARETVRGMYRAAAAEDDEDQRKALARWATKSESLARIKAMIELAQTEPGIVSPGEAFDADPDAFNTLAGVLDLKTGALSPADPNRLLTRVSPVWYRVGATAPGWLTFLDRILAGDLGLIEFLQRAVGYSLCGSTAEHCFFMLWGTGANGKSTFLELLRHVFGDYAIQCPAETFLAKRSGGIPNDLARLRGPRLATAVETDDGRRLAESLVKQLTGADTVTARFLHHEFFEFRPEFKVWLATNHKPVIRGTDLAIWRRVRLIPFAVTIPEAEQDKQLPEKLKGEAPGILSWALEGHRLWREHGLGTVEAVQAATETYRQESDPVGQWIEERCVTGPSLRGLGLYSDFEAWAKANGHAPPLCGREFSGRLAERGHTPTHTKRGTVYLGVGLAAEAPAWAYGER